MSLLIGQKLLENSLVTLFDRKLDIFKNLLYLIIFGIFNKLLSTQNVNVARFARNDVECDFFCDFQTLFLISSESENLEFSWKRVKSVGEWSTV